MTNLILYVLLQAISVVGGVFAFWKGGAAERFAAVVVVINLLIGMSGDWLAPSNSETIRLCNDGLAALALLVITVRYGALWMGGVMLFFAVQFSLTSYYMVTDRPPKDYFYALVNNVDWNGVVWCLIIGTAVAWRHRRHAARLAAQPAP
jgi:membrane-bound ClpP family serine protease